MERKSNGDTNISWHSKNSPQGFGKETGGSGYQDYTDLRILKIS